MKKVNRIEISSFLFSKKEAESQVEQIINNRKNKIYEAKKEWIESLGVLKEAQIELEKKEKEYNDLKDGLDTEQSVIENEDKVKNISAEIKEMIKEISVLQKDENKKRLTKVNRIKKLNIKAYQIIPVKCVGKRGGNWIFLS